MLVAGALAAAKLLETGEFQSRIEALQAALAEHEPDAIGLFGGGAA